MLQQTIKRFVELFKFLRNLVNGPFKEPRERQKAHMLKIYPFLF